MRTFVIGDPQGPFAKVQDVLGRHGLIDGDRLAADVVLISIGDHFDYNYREPIAAGQEGLRLLRWLAAHDPAQVHLLLGNHDAARVMELATITDAEFEAIRAGEPRDMPAHLPPHGVFARDYASFTAEQRALVIELLLAGRFHLGLAGELADGRRALLTHAGVTAREIALLGTPADPPAIARALDAHLHASVDRVRAAWRRGELAALSLEPLHVVGGAGYEGGGLLYHRPSNPARGSEFHPQRPRRFDPRTLPRGLVQVAGHSGHAKCVHELGVWCTRAAHERAHGGIRTLRVVGDDVTYDLGVSPPVTGAAELILVDGELRRVPADEVELLPLARLL